MLSRLPAVLRLKWPRQQGEGCLTTIAGPLTEAQTQQGGGRGPGCGGGASRTVVTEALGVGIGEGFLAMGALEMRGAAGRKEKELLVSRGRF